MSEPINNEVLSAGINFGKPATEFIVEATPEGEATSCRNVVTGVEYIGGGGGGDSDFSVAEVTVTLVATEGAALIGLDLPNTIFINETPLGDALDIREFKSINGSENEEVTIYQIIMKKNAIVIFDASQDPDSVVATGGSIEETIYPGGYIITGNCAITLKRIGAPE